MEQFFVILQQLFIFTVFILVGIICVKCNVIDKTALDYISKFVIMVTMPIMLFSNMLSGPSLDKLITSLPIFIIYLSCFLILFFLNCIIAKLFKFDSKKSNIYKALSTFSNAGFIGIPLILSLFNKQGAVYMSLCMIVDQLMLWTLGIKLTSSTKKNSDSHITFKNFKNLINPALVAIVISILGIILGVRLPKTIQIALLPIGNITPPLSLIYIGGLFCYSDIKKYIKNIEIYSIVIFKMILFPIAIWFILKVFYLPVDMIKTVVLLTALPTMSSIAMFAKKYENHSEYAVGTVLITTMLSIITLPIVSCIINYF